MDSVIFDSDKNVSVPIYLSSPFTGPVSFLVTVPPTFVCFTDLVVNTDLVAQLLKKYLTSS